MNIRKSLLAGIGANLVFVLGGLGLETLYPERMTWFAQEFPSMMSGDGALFVFVSILITGFVMGFLYDLLRMGIPGKGIRKGINFGIIAYLLGGISFAFMILGSAPTAISASEFGFSFITHVLAGIVVAKIHE